MKKIAVMNFSGQYNHLISRRIKEINGESILLSGKTPLEEIEKQDIAGIILGGGPDSIPNIIGDELYMNLKNILINSQIPILGICLTHQMIASIFNGEVKKSQTPEYGPIEVIVEDDNDILNGLGSKFQAWASHTDEVVKIPNEAKILAKSENCKIEALKIHNRNIFGVQFHPEVSHTQKGGTIFRNFLSLC